MDSLNSEIKIKVSLDENKMPDRIHWHSSDNPDQKGDAECKAFFLSLFDKDHKDTLRIDLWTKEMQVSEMDRFVYYTLRGLSDTYLKATNNKELANHMQNFTSYFGEQTGILPNSES